MDSKDPTASSSPLPPESKKELAHNWQGVGNGVRCSFLLVSDVVSLFFFRPIIIFVVVFCLLLQLSSTSGGTPCSAYQPWAVLNVQPLLRGFLHSNFLRPPCLLLRDPHEGWVSSLDHPSPRVFRRTFRALIIPGPVERPRCIVGPESNLRTLGSSTPKIRLCILGKWVPRSLCLSIYLPLRLFGFSDFLGWRWPPSARLR